MKDISRIVKIMIFVFFLVNTIYFWKNKIGIFIFLILIIGFLLYTAAVFIFIAKLFSLFKN